MSDIDVIDHTESSRFEARSGDEVVGHIDYQRAEGRVTITRTEVSSEHEGEGVGSSLVRGALDRVRADGEQVEVQCPFVQRWLDKHEDYQDLQVGDRASE